jgi:hypothetical protein
MIPSRFMRMKEKKREERRKETGDDFGFIGPRLIMLGKLRFRNYTSVR